MFAFCFIQAFDEFVLVVIVILFVGAKGREFKTVSSLLLPCLWSRGAINIVQNKHAGN